MQSSGAGSTIDEAAMPGDSRRIGPGHDVVQADLRAMPIEVARVLDELHRVLRPGGALVCVTPMPARRLTHAAMQAAARIASRTTASRIGGPRPLDPTSMLEQSGFDVAHTRDVGRGNPSLCVRALRQVRAASDPSATTGLDEHAYRA